MLESVYIYNDIKCQYSIFLEIEAPTYPELNLHLALSYLQGDFVSWLGVEGSGPCATGCEGVQGERQQTEGVLKRGKGNPL